MHTGYLEDVTTLMQEVRCLAAPLQWGAGVKGKITQSLASGLPVVTSRIGAEGLALENEITALVEDENAAFAHAIARLLTDDVLWAHLSRNGHELAERQYSMGRLEETVKALMNSDLK